MENITKASVTFGNNSIELEGREEFVSKYLESFKEIIEIQKSQKPSSIIKTEKPDAISNKNNQDQSSKSEKSKKKRIKSIEAEEFDIFESKDSPTLEEFINQKSPGKTAGKVIVVIAYYMQQIKNLPTFTEGNIEYAYKILSLPSRPIYIRQIIINMKNKNQWFEESEDGLSWKLTRVGEVFVKEKLPSQERK